MSLDEARTWISTHALIAKGCESHKQLRRARSGMSHWLRKIEALRPGDACEFHYPARAQWLMGTIVVNGGSGWWSVVDETDVEGSRGKIIEGLYIEGIRLPGQTEAWA